MIKHIKTYIEGQFAGLSASLVSEMKSQNNILQSEIGALSREVKDRDVLHERIAELERENATLEETVEDAYEECAEVSEKLEKVLKDWGEAGEEHLKREACSEAEIERQKVFIKNAEGLLATAEEAQAEQRAIIAQLKHKVEDTELALKDATQANVVAVAKQERLLTLAKEYDKATVTFLNAVLERKSATEERKAWEVAKEALKAWDSPVAKRKPGRPKKQS